MTAFNAEYRVLADELTTGDPEVNSELYDLAGRMLMAMARMSDAELGGAEDLKRDLALKMFGAPIEQILTPEGEELFDNLATAMLEAMSEFE